MGHDSVVVDGHFKHHDASIMTSTSADEVLVELTSVADAVWTWAAHEGYPFRASQGDGFQIYFNKEVIWFEL